MLGASSVDNTNNHLPHNMSNHQSITTYTQVIARPRRQNSESISIETSHPPTTNSAMKYMQGNDRSRHHVQEESQTQACLFCEDRSDTTIANLQHMSSEHSLYIPQVELLTSLEAFIGYLRTVINEFKECLYCGVVRSSTASIRQHMIDKGHCMINIDQEPELLEFWEEQDEQLDDLDEEKRRIPKQSFLPILGDKDSSTADRMLPSGRIIATKNETNELHRLSRRLKSATRSDPKQLNVEGLVGEPEVLPTMSLVAPTSTLSGERVRDTRISVRDATALLGVPDQQLKSLITMQHKWKAKEVTLRMSRTWADELGGTHQKHYKQKMNLRDG